MTCTEKCWTPKPCPDHGDSMAPFGRSVSAYAHECCESRMDGSINPRHLWGIHDSTRWYTDPEGWIAHEQGCAECSPELDE